MVRAGNNGASEAVPVVPRPLRLAAWFVLAGAGIVIFEFALYLTALTLFTHMDTPECAGADTFCYPDGRTGVTGGTVVVLLGNLGALAILAALVVLLLARRRAARARSS